MKIRFSNTEGFSYLVEHLLGKIIEHLGWVDKMV